jgi:hypothetical protein
MGGRTIRCIGHNGSKILTWQHMHCESLRWDGYFTVDFIFETNLLSYIENRKIPSETGAPVCSVYEHVTFYTYVRVDEHVAFQLILNYQDGS